MEPWSDMGWVYVSSQGARIILGYGIGGIFIPCPWSANVFKLPWSTLSGLTSQKRRQLTKDLIPVHCIRAIRV